MKALRSLLTVALFTTTLALTAQVDSSRYTEMHWRMIGPFRGGRTVAAVGVPQQPGVFYIGVNNGGVWKTNDYGRVWAPIFDDQLSGSIGAIAVAPSDPNIIYAGSGEGLQRPDLATGDGIYKSTDAGKTWTHLGLRDGQQIPMIAVDPHDPNRLFVAVLGHPFGPNNERGIYRSTDGGTTFEKVLSKDEAGGIDVVLDPSNAQTVYAALWETRYGPWENAYLKGPNNGIFKSTDGGTTWHQLTKGLPEGEALGRAGLEVSRANPQRIYTIAGVDEKSGGVYRSDDGGESWQRMNDDERVWGRPGDFNEIRSDPKNADIVYSANVVTWKSIDGGKTWSAFRGAPGGDDYHRIWIDPNDSKLILIASDQGAIITVNGGMSWSSWYNQPTAQLYHVNADNAFPYRVCGGQQESGSACVESRSDDGRITFHDWHPVAAEEYGYAVPDPLDPDIVYGGRISRYDRRNRQVQDITPKALRGKTYRMLRTQPIAFSPADPHILFFAANMMWKTTNGGRSWTQISPDLTRKTWDVPSNVGKYKGTPEAKPKQRGVIYAIAPSPLDVNRIWAGTDDGLIHVTTDGGKTWKDVTPPQLVPWAKVSIMEASHFDKLTAYAAINTFRLDDLRPHILRTRDGGKTWTEIVNGIANGADINVVREDPKTKGLLFAGSETQVWFSNDDGAHWQSLRQNMPATAIRDLVVKDDDLIAGTHGRGFWILDDIQPLRVGGGRSGGDGDRAGRPLAADETSALLKPQRATRFRWSKWPDTPLPPDEPAGQNPPDGAIIDYVLASNASLVTLEVLDANGKLVRRYASTDKTEQPKDTGNVPWYWIRPSRALATSAGMHRFTWDLHSAPISQIKPSYPISAVPFDTAPNYTSPWVVPGTYTVKLTVDGKSSTQPLTVRMDPRVKTTHEELVKQFTISMKLHDLLQQLAIALEELRGIKSSLQADDKFGKDLSELEGDEDEDQPTLARIQSNVRSLFDNIQAYDGPPTAQQLAAVNDVEPQVKAVLGRWETLRKRRASAAGYEIYAIRYGTIPEFPVASLVQGADKSRKLDIAMMIWLLRGNGHNVLVDSGFYHPQFFKNWKVADFVRPDEAVARLGVHPNDVTDLILTHAHWDHADGADLFPKAQIWIQKEEFRYYTTADHPGMDKGDMEFLRRAHREGRVHLVDGDREILPGISVYTGGRHTYASQYVRAGDVVLASDNVYLYENLTNHVPIAQTLDATSNLAAQDRMKTLAQVIVPGHDPEVLTRFARVAEGVVAISAPVPQR